MARGTSEEGESVWWWSLNVLYLYGVEMGLRLRMSGFLSFDPCWRGQPFHVQRPLVTGIGIGVNVEPPIHSRPRFDPPVFDPTNLIIINLIFIYSQHTTYHSVRIEFGPCHWSALVHPSPNSALTSTLYFLCTPYVCLLPRQPSLSNPCHKLI